MDLFILPILGDELNKILSSKVLHFDVGSESLRLTAVWRVLPQIWPFRTYARLTGILSTRWFYMSLINQLRRVVQARGSRAGMRLRELTVSRELVECGKKTEPST